MKKNLRKLGFTQIILSGICFGFLGLFGKLAYQRNISPGELLALRYLLSAIITGALILFTSRKSFFSLSSFEIISSICLGIFGYALFSSLYFMALMRLSASLTVLLLYTYPIMVTLFSRFFLHEKMGKLGVVALLLVSVGIVGLVWGEWSASEPKYILAGLGSALFYALYIILSRKYLSEVAAIPSSFYVQLGAGIVLSIIHFHGATHRPFEIIRDHYALIFSMSILCSLMAMTLFLAGLQKIKSSEASILSMTEPISGVLIASLFLHEKMQFIQIMGGVLILFGMAIISLKKTSQDE